MKRLPKWLSKGLLAAGLILSGSSLSGSSRFNRRKSTNIGAAEPPLDCLFCFSSFSNQCAVHGMEVALGMTQISERG